MKIPVEPLVMKDVLLTIGLDDYEAGVSAVLFTPSVNTQTATWKGLTPTSVHTFVENDPTTWSVQLTYAQDWKTPDSLSRYLHANAGQTKPVIFRPKSGEGPSFTADVVIVPGPIGGQRGLGAVESSVTCPVDGDVELEEPAP